MATAVVATGYGGPEHLAVVEREVPAPGTGEVTLEVKAAGVNPIDFKLYGGTFGRDPARLPMPLGLEVSGVITAVGEAASGPAGPLAVGDEVVAYPVSGGYATEVTAKASVVVPKPSEVSWDAAAGLLLAGGTAVHALARLGLREGETLVIHGASGMVGLLALQLAVAAGVNVIGTASEKRHELLRQHGAVPVAYGNGLLERLRAAAPSGVDAVFDVAGTEEAIDASLELVPDRDRIVSAVAFSRGDTGIQLIGSGPGADPGTEIRAQAWRQLLPAAGQRRLEVPIARVFPLAEAAEAHRLAATGHPGGKIVLHP
ncbi:NADP-dependent oxidoreductase [Amycolatopsis taiwanensis]|uniref:Oxidoreductase n=1 Tax=Amycolatopsis taiwanensis TaxID=342230 RepID=A0A9W6R1W0_9PSEU|nr:NADP-dependent oxidoreductase [Amycolatopsis taiwanensis]GLY67773.1 putative oxidoreductase [Amycolatopsis taiwanensis]